ncbi:unnamed protein product, partial [Adineta steineri]
MNIERRQHTQTILTNELVLVAGGYNGAYLNSAELYNSSAGTWTTTGNMTVKRFCHTASKLADGSVLVAGGFNDANGAYTSPVRYLNSAELYNPSTGTWTTTGSMSVRRQDHTASTLANGSVLIVGGFNSDGHLNSAELYNPSAGTWTTTGNMSAARAYHKASTLKDGSVLVAG